MPDKVLITGGAGFIGTHLAAELLAHGYQVKALDSLEPQVHGASHVRPEHLPNQVELEVARIEDRAAVDRALADVDAVVHLAAMVGVGQSMYEISRYTRTNTWATAKLLEAMIERKVGRLVVASSMSVYGEGAYRSDDGQLHSEVARKGSDLRRGLWDPLGDGGRPLVPVPTPEAKTPCLASIYALSKYDQERMCLMIGEAYGIQAVALRFFNVYGPFQALSNPYTGVLAIFGSRYLNDRAPLIFEDGLQQRDFVHVRDVARACRQALERDAAAGRAINVGSGQPKTVTDVAQAMGTALSRDYIEPEITGQYRVGDIRHCFADIALARTVLDYMPEVDFDDGLAELAEWLKDQRADDRVVRAREELVSRGLAL